MKIAIRVHSEFGDMAADLIRIRKSLNFSQVVLEGINTIQKWQRFSAPIGHTGRGPHGRIPRSIRPARVFQRPDGSAWATSRTNYGPAIFTSEGTGQWGPSKRPYFIARENELTGSRGYFHPGQRGTGWWERGLDMATPFALQAFQRKVESALRIRKL